MLQEKILKALCHALMHHSFWVDTHSLNKPSDYFAGYTTLYPDISAYSFTLSKNFPFSERRRFDRGMTIFSAGRFSNKLNRILWNIKWSFCEHREYFLSSLVHRSGWHNSSFPSIFEFCIRSYIMVWPLILDGWGYVIIWAPVYTIRWNID